MLSFRPMQLEDMPRIVCWLTTPGPAMVHYNQNGRYAEELAEDFRKGVPGTSKTAGYIIQVDGRPIGYIQSYSISDYPEHAESLGAPLHSAGIDLFIGEEDYLGRGIGPQTIRKFLQLYVFIDEEVECCLVDPSRDNSRSIRAFEKVGFEKVRESTSPDGRPTVVLFLDKILFGSQSSGF